MSGPPPDHPIGLNTESNDIFEYVRKPRRYFRVGRVFATRWAEPWSEYKDASKNPSPRLSPKSRVFEETRRFIVVQESHGASLCVPIHTYGGRGLGKDNIRLEDHARVYDDKTNPPKQEPHMREPIGVVVEPDSKLPQLHPQSVANFGKIYTVEHGVKIANIGFVHKSQKHQLQVSYLHHSNVQGSLAAIARYLHSLINGEAGVDIHNNIHSNDLKAAATSIDRLRDPGAGIEAHRRVSNSDLQTASVEGPDIDTPHRRVSENAPQAAPLADKPTVPQPCDKNANVNERSTSPHNEQRPQLAGRAKRKNADTNERSTSPHNEKRQRTAGRAKRENTDAMPHSSNVTCQQTCSPPQSPQTDYSSNKGLKHDNAQSRPLVPA